MTEMPPVLSQSELVDMIKKHHRFRNDYHVPEKGMITRIRATCRQMVRGMHCKGTKCNGPNLCKNDMSESGRLYDAIDARHKRENQIQEMFPFIAENEEQFKQGQMKIKDAKRFITIRNKYDALEDIHGQDSQEVIELFYRLRPHLTSRDLLEMARIEHEKTMKAFAKQLPVYPWVESVSGVGELSLALIVGEAGNLSNYATHGKLFKFMGLAVIDGQRQRKAKDKALAEVIGYNPRRRSVSWQIAHSMFLAQSPRTIKETCEVTKPAGPYRLIYDEYKARKTAERPDLKPIVINSMAQRYMEKRFLKDLWQAWREVSG